MGGSKERGRGVGWDNYMERKTAGGREWVKNGGRQ